MLVKRYFCTGTCGAIVTEEDYNNGLRGCGTESCNMHGAPFEEGLFCTACQERVYPGQEYQHQH